MRTLALVVLSAVVTSACVHAKQVKPAVAAVVEATPAPAPVAEPVAEDAMAEVEAALHGAKVRFAFDSDSLTEDSAAALQRVAKVLRKHRALTLRIEGNSDERGTEEYNLFLGQRRADAAFRYLVDLGVSPLRMETVSYGALQPLVDEHSEEAWSENRRDELHVAAPGTARVSASR